jgi:hypothetical protein
MPVIYAGEMATARQMIADESMMAAVKAVIGAL